jgi:glycosyltransferase involved in cell wall biosynthesis
VELLVVTQYYRPEIGATQNRLGAFVDGLAERGHSLTVVCEQPNHPAGVFQPGFGRRAVMTAREGSVRVRRVWVAASPVKTTTRRLLFYGSFAAAAGALTLTGRRPDVMLTSSPPLPGALTAAAAARQRGIPFVLDVRDLWPAAAEALGELSNPAVLRAFELAERWAYRAAARVTATTRPFCEHVDARAGAGKAVHVPNGALDELLSVETPPRQAGAAFTVGYAGNFGIAQGLGVVLDAATETRDEHVRFLLVGEGPLKAKFVAERDRRGLADAVDVRPGIPAADVAPLLAGCDALLVPLRDHPLLRDFIPSKLYDAMALGRPALVAAPGEAEHLVQETGCGLAVPAEDGPALAAAIRRMRGDPSATAAMGARGRAAAGDFVRSRQVARLEQVLVEAAA